jgi:L-ascorbate metabolism protein UlaG (beta-lactamase superfamily)
MKTKKGFFAPALFTLPLALAASCASGGADFDEAAWLEEVNAADSAALYAPHIDKEGRFFNPWMPRSRQRENTRSRGFFFRKKTPFEAFPEERYAALPNDYSYLGDSSDTSISFAGHASMIIKIDGQTIFTDPFFSNRALVIGKTVKIKFDFSKVPRRPLVLISHNHYDHLDTWTVKKLIQKDAVFIVPLGLKSFFEKLKAKEVYELDWWQSAAAGGIEYTLLPAQHWSRRIGAARNTTLWGGFLIRASKTIFFSGDSGYFCGFREFGKRWNIDYAILGTGAYEPRWFMHYAHMNVREFFMAAEDLRAKTVIPMHFGVISLSDEPLVYPLYEIESLLQNKPEFAQVIRPMRVGERLSL